MVVGDGLWAVIQNCSFSFALLLLLLLLATRMCMVSGGSGFVKLLAFIIYK